MLYWFCCITCHFSRKESGMKFVSKLVLMCAMFFSSLATIAQPITYSVRDGYDQPMGIMVITYTSTGYYASMNGKTTSVDMAPGTGPYWHKVLGFERVLPYSIAGLGAGVHKMLYVGPVPQGHLYREEVWFNGQVFGATQTVVDKRDQILWSIARDPQGIMRLDRL